jgi:hypothetical protein
MSKIHQPYEELWGHMEDFIVKYKFYSPEEGGRKTVPHQGIRSDFWYECNDHDTDSLYMIYPQFQDINGIMIPSGVVEKEGIAKMWILSEELRPYHQKRIKLGTVGYFMEGSRRTARCKVIEIVGLMSNPIKSK